jgi:hypothetical protein
LSLPIGVIARQLRAKFLLPRRSQMREPVRVGSKIFLDSSSPQAVPAQFRTHAKRPLASGSMIDDEIFHITPIVEQFFGAQRIEQKRHDSSIVTFLEQFKAQIFRCVVAPRQRIEGEDPGCARVLGLGRTANQGVTPL